MLGDAFLVAPVVSTQNASKVFLPEGDWYCLHSDKKMAGNTEVLVETPLYRLPVFVKAGSIVPQQQNTLSFDDSAGDTLWVHVYKGKGLNEWTYYEDDGESYAYEKGEYLIQRFQYNAEANTIAVEKAENSGSRISKFKHIKFVLHGFSPSALPTINGKKTKFNRRLTTAVFPPELHKAELYYAPLEQLEVYIQE
jgi:alpha-glucosidase